MTDFGDRLARVLQDAVPDPPHDLDPAALRAAPARRERRKRVLAAARRCDGGGSSHRRSVAAHHLAAAISRTGPSPRGPAVPSPPAGFSASEFGMALSGVPVVGGIALPRATCTPRQISATAATRRTDGGVLGVIRLVGAVISHVKRADERCALPIAQGPSALTGAGRPPSDSARCRAETGPALPPIRAPT